MEVLLLGTGSADGWPNPFCACSSCRSAKDEVRGQTAALVDDVLMLDLGPDVPRAAVRLGRSLERVRDVLLTHAHPDHTGPPALLWRAWAEVRTPLRMHGPEEALDLCRPWVGPKDPVTFHPVRAGDSWHTGSHEILALAANHGDALIGPGLLWDVTDSTGRRILWATDTGWPPPQTLDELCARSVNTPYDAVFLEETFGARQDLGEQHLHLDTFGRLVDRWRTEGVIGDNTQVIAIHMSHHNPPEAALQERLRVHGARPGHDGEAVQVASSGSVGSVGRRLLVLGGARSGKSALAEGVLSAHAGPVTYVATSTLVEDDPEWLERVARHRARRPAQWQTVESTDLVTTLDSAGPDEAVLIDCLTVWLSRRMDDLGCWAPVQQERAAADKALTREIERLCTALTGSRATVVLVSNEVGHGVVPATRSGRLFRDELGRLNVAMANASDDVVVVIAGQPLAVKGGLW